MEVLLYGCGWEGVMLGFGAIFSRGGGIGRGTCVARELCGGPEGRSTAPDGMRKWEEMLMCSGGYWRTRGEEMHKCSMVYGSERDIF